MLRDSSRFLSSALFSVLVMMVGCSSDKAAPATTSAKTCADLAKCCDSQSEPQKSTCAAAASAKVEDMCSTNYDKFCVAGDAGGGESGPSTDPVVQARCDGYCAKSCNSAISRDYCVQACAEASRKDAKCSSEFVALADCYAKAGSFSCKDMDPVVEGCDSTKFTDCQSKP